MKIASPKSAFGVLMSALMLSSVNGWAQERNDATCSLPQSIKVDAFETLPLEAQRARLEKIIPVLSTYKHSHGFFVSYAGRRSSLAEAQQRADRAKRQLLEKHQWIGSDGLNSRLNTLVCGHRETPAMEVWVTPVGAAPPVCTPTVRVGTTGAQAPPPRRR